jgi:hypothetical protein
VGPVRTILSPCRDRRKEECMEDRALPFVMAAATLLVAAPGALATTAGNCELPAQDADLLADRETMLQRYERLPQHCLKAIVHACTAASAQALLDFGSAAACSFSYEALLKNGFGGNFHALMAWWRSERREPPQ